VGEKLQQGYEYSKPYLNKAGEYTMDKAKQAANFTGEKEKKIYSLPNCYINVVY